MDPKNARRARENIMFLCQTKMMIIDIKNVVTNITVMHAIPEIQKNTVLSLPLPVNENAGKTKNAMHNKDTVASASTLKSYHRHCR